MQLTRIVGASSTDATAVSCTTAAFALAYALRPGAAPTAFIDDMVTTDPGRPPTARANPRSMRYVVSRLKSKHARHASTSESTIDAWYRVPAKLTRTFLVSLTLNRSAKNRSTAPGSVASTLSCAHGAGSGSAPLDSDTTSAPAS